jgi:hypothetical protein
MDHDIEMGRAVRSAAGWFQSLWTRGDFLFFWFRTLGLNLGPTGIGHWNWACSEGHCFVYFPFSLLETS